MEAPVAFKDLLVIIDSTPGTPQRLEVAARLQARFAAHLSGLFLMPLPDYHYWATAYNVSRASLQKVLAADANAAQEKSALAHKNFEDYLAREGLAGEWRETFGLPSEQVTLHARYADLVILGQHDPDQEQAYPELPHPEDIALTAGRPCLVVPNAGAFPTVGRHALIAWNASQQAVRAVNDALPLLELADRVTVLVANPDDRHATHGQEPGADIALHLARHGIKVTVETATTDGIEPAEFLLSRAADIGADLLVMGAYGHSRVREWVTGGTTRTILRSMTLPVFMSH